MRIATISASTLELYYRYRIYRSADFAEAINYDPLAVRWVDTNLIEKMIPLGNELCRAHTPGEVVAGDWDLNYKPFRESIHYRSLRAHFDDDVPWRETNLYRDAIQRSADSRYHGCETEAEVLDHLRTYDAVYASMAADGYQPQTRLKDSEGFPSSLLPPQRGEIYVNIGRDGTFLFDDGRHRLSMAKLLDIEEVPVIVIARHEKYVESEPAAD